MSDYHEVPRSNAKSKLKDYGGSLNSVASLIQKQHKFKQMLNTNRESPLDTGRLSELKAL
jgi:hypothetical protein